MIPTTRTLEALTYSAPPAPFTDLSVPSAIVRERPEPLPELCRVVPGLIVHPFLAHLYGLEPQRLRQDDLQIRSASEILDRVLAVDPRSLSEPRPPERRFVGNCRHFTVLLCALLRARGLPARARCGFGAYFAPPRFEDHWVDRKSTRLNSSHSQISYAVFCLKKKKKTQIKYVKNVQNSD